jgi:quinol monooxygenase YgiN
MTAGSALWGTVAQATSIQTALLAAAGGGLLAGLLAARLVPLPAGEADLTPSMHWPEPASSGPIPGERGPVMIAVEYRIEPSDRRAFLKALAHLAKARRRDGAFGWRVMEDAEDPHRFEEVFYAASWLDHLRQHRRVTRTDAELQLAVQAFHRGDGPPRARHLLAARSTDEGHPALLNDHRH